ncbi:MAG: hypothetical protein GX025_05325 [Clostridiales bacterium]|nr:hypothetical protein [Clostridiales bacterium]
MNNNAISGTAAATNNKINAVFTNKTDNATMTSSDFLKLFVAQMQNQDFTNPMDNSEMMNQITQLSNMQMMQEMALYSKSSYAMSMVGKTVTASRFTINGDLDTTTGTVDKVSLVDGEYIFYIGGKKYTLEQIMQVQTGDAETGSTINPESFSIKADSVTQSSATVSWTVPTEDEAAASNLKYTVYYSTEGPFNTVEKVEAGTMAGLAERQGLTSYTINGLESGSSYYINVVVTEENGTKSVYKPTITKTNY